MYRVLPREVKVLIKLTQSQKTQYTVNQIIESYEDDNKTFFVYICHNITASLTQTTCRVEKNLNDHFNDYPIKPNILKFISSGSSEDSTYINTHHIACSVLSQNPEKYMGIFVLAHSIRFKSKHIESIIKTINNIGHYSRIHIYFDEFDRYSNMIIKTIDNFCAVPKVELYELVSATISDSPLLKAYGDIPPDNIIDIWVEGSYDPNYYITYDEQIKNKKLITFDLHGESLIFKSLYHFFGDMSGNKKSFYGFIPAHIKKVTHYEVMHTIKKVLPDVTFCIVNSDFKGFILPTGETYSFDLIGKEILDVIIDAKKTLGIKKLIVTGNGCVGRSVTLQGKHSNTDDIIIFDFAIYDNEVVTNGDNAYQLDRTKGNIKRFGSKCPVIYCTPKYKKWVVNREKIAMIGENDTKVSFRTHQQHIKERMILPSSTNLIQFEDIELNLSCPSECKKFLNSHGLIPKKDVSNLKIDESTGKFMGSFEGSAAVLDYETHITTFRKFSPIAKYNAKHLKYMEEEATTNECIFFRWALYKGDTPYYYLKVLVKV